MVATDEFTSASQNVEAANAAVAEFLNGAGGDTEFPNIDSDLVEEIELPGGYLANDGRLVKKAHVRELTGEDEEAIAKALVNPSRITTVILNRGVESIGDEKATPHMLKELLIGDRAALLVGIRRATYGESIDYNVFCPNCSEWLETTITLDDLPMKTLDDPTERVFEVKLRKGGIAKVKLPDGFTDEEVMEAQAKLSIAQQNTLLLSKCVTHINGSVVIGTGPVLRMGSADRRTILNKISELSPGPQYDKITFTHDVCGREVNVPLNVGDLFQF